MPTPSDIVRLLEEYGVIAASLARASLERLDSESPPSLSTLLAEFKQAGHITDFLKEALEEGRVEEVQVSDHLLLSLIGQGGMGRVYRARSRVMHRDVAIKLMRTDVLKDESAHKRFLQEVRTAGELDHPHIVSAYHAGRHGEGYYLSMELVQGETLSNILREHGPLGLRDALQLAIQICKGLEYAYEYGFVHRDIKPANLLIDEQRQVKILDLGLSRRIAEKNIEGEEGRGGKGSSKRSLREPAERLTESGSFIGTSTFMAPEQAEEPQSADHRADMYSLGCTLFLMMTGRPPYKEQSGVKLLLAHRQAAIPSVCEIRDDATPQIDALLRRLLAKSPKDRPESYAEIISDLKDCLESLKPPSLGHGEIETDSDTMVLPPQPRGPKPEPSSSGLHWIMAMIIVLLLGIASWDLLPWNHGDQDFTPDATQSVVVPPVVTTRAAAGTDEASLSAQSTKAPRPVSPETTYLVTGDPRRVEFPIPSIDRGGTLRFAVRRIPSDGSNTGPLIVSLPTREGRIFISMDRQTPSGREHFIGFKEDRVAAKFDTDFSLGPTPKTIAITIRSGGITVSHGERVFFSWKGDPHSLQTGQNWSGGSKPYFSRQEGGRFQVDSVQWSDGADEHDD